MGSPVSISAADRLLFWPMEARSAALAIDLASSKVMVCAQQWPIRFIKCNITSLLDKSYLVLQWRVMIFQKAFSYMRTLAWGMNVPVTGLMIYHSANYK